jgi:chromosome segregation ATPase
MKIKETQAALLSVLFVWWRKQRGGLSPFLRYFWGLTKSFEEIRILGHRFTIMKDFFSVLFSQQASTAAARDGLPYWTFWLLISFILLLLAFIFLRDKDLRRKMDEFFFRTRKRLIRLRHQKRLARENKRKDRLVKELGQMAWERNIEINNGKKVFRELQYLDGKNRDLVKESEEIDTKISFLKTSLEENTKKFNIRMSEKEEEKFPHVEKLLDVKIKEKEIETEVIKKQQELTLATKTVNSTKKELQDLEENGAEWDDKKKADVRGIEEKLDKLSATRESIDNEINAIVRDKEAFEQQRKEHEKAIERIEKEINKVEHENKDQIKEYEKEIKEWEKNKSRVGERIQKVAREKEPLFEDYGALVEMERVNHGELDVFYSQIDRVALRISEIEKQIQALD